MRLLVVKTSSMGDVVHAMPVVRDILVRHPQAQIDWLVEAPFAAIAEMHPGIRRVWPMAWRKWRGQLGSAATWRAMGQLRSNLHAAKYDLVLDLQGLIKSALWARQARAPVAGYDRRSIREPLAAQAYQRTAAVPRGLHAVQRCRLLAAAHLGLPPPAGEPDFGLRAPSGGWLPRGNQGDYAVLIPNASRPEKLWPERHWVEVGKRLLERGCTPLVLWGRPSEQTLAERIAAGCEGDVPPFLGVGAMAAVLAGARQVVGLDTGFTHLAAAFGKPTVGIYCDHEPGLAGITGPGRVASIGGKGQVPSRKDVLALLEQQLAS
ncbi:MAG TPA: lipopolysaccharide heptosyltransferase I [Rubrivivax sp.]|nr:lipopolysaccharide heptosyltransferase I [Rubrivivax sp.]